MKNHKNGLIILLILLIVSILTYSLSPIVVFAAEDSNYYRAYFRPNDYSNGISAYLDGENLSTSKVAYCFEHDKAHPPTLGGDELPYYETLDYLTSTDLATVSSATKAKIAAALYAGYPNDAYGLRAKWGLTVGEAEYKTQQVIWGLIKYGDSNYANADLNSDYLHSVAYYAYREMGPATGTLSFSGSTQLVESSGIYKTGNLDVTGTYTGTFNFSSIPNGFILKYTQNDAEVTVDLRVGDRVYFEYTGAGIPNGTFSADYSYKYGKVNFYKQAVLGSEKVYQNLINLDSITNNDKLTITGIAETISIVGTKIWNDKGIGASHPSDIDITLSDGSTHRVTPDLNGDWMISGLPKYDSLGKEIIYSIISENCGDANWTSSISGNTITNTYVTKENPNGSITINKAFNGHAPINDVTFTVTGPNNYSKSFTYGEMSNDSYTITNLPLGTYSVTETGASINNYSLKTVIGDPVTLSEKNLNGTISIVNTYTEVTPSEPSKPSIPTGSITITKIFNGHAPINDVIFTVTGPNNYSKSFTYGEISNGRYTLTNLALGTYSVTETGASIKDYSLKTAIGDPVTLSEKNLNGTISIVNTYTEVTPSEPSKPITPTGSITITKTFNGHAPINNVTFTVTGPNNYSKSFTYGEMSNGSYTITNLAFGTYSVTETGAAIINYLVETAIGKPVTLSEKNLNGTISIVNTYTEITPSEPLKPSTPTDNNTIEKPNITDESVIISKPDTTTESKITTHEPSNVISFNNNGGKTIDKSPETGDNTPITFLWIFAIGSFMAAIALFVFGRKKGYIRK